MEKAVTALLTAVLCLSCSRPGAVETFVPAEDATGGHYKFPMEFYDSTLTYSLSFYARRDVPRHRRNDFPPSRLVVKWIAPDGACRLVDTVYMDMGTSSGTVAPYRDGIHPLRQGMWSLDVEVSDPGPAFRGLGLVCSGDGAR